MKPPEASSKPDMTKVTVWRPSTPCLLSGALGASTSGRPSSHFEVEAPARGYVTQVKPGQLAAQG